MYVPLHTSRPAALLLAALLMFVGAPTAARAQRSSTSAPSTAATTAAGTIAGIVSTQNGTIPLGGALVSLLTTAGDVGNYTSDGDGGFHFDNVPPGAYRVVVALEGFDSITLQVSLAAGQSAALKPDLRIASVSERVEVVASKSIVPTAGTLTTTEGLTGKELEDLTGRGGLQSALKLLVSVIQVPGGVSIKGGRPSQASVQLGNVTFVDPATGLSQVSLPDDAVDSVTVLPNPYAVEYGRFSSGLVLIRTRRAGDVWKTRLNDIDPSLRTERGSVWKVVGVSSFSPRLETGGPLIKDKLFLQQAFQYRYHTNDVESRPLSELKRSYLFSSFTRVDANLNARHSLVSAVGFFPGKVTQATLGTFTPPDASVDMKGDARTASLTERALWSDHMFTETTVEAHGFSTDVLPQGTADMQLFPETTLGNFFNQQHRETSTLQFIESLSGTRQTGAGLHLYKAGIDILHSQYSSTSASRPVLILRSDGTLARRIDFTSPFTVQADRSTDLAVYAQDRVQPGERWYVELGARLDRDGVLGNLNLTPRVGGAFLLKKDGTSVIRSGYGLFFERTPSVAGVFDQYEAEIDTRFADDGVTPLAPPALIQHVTQPDLRTSRSLTWDLAFDHRFNARWALHVSGIDRHGEHELLLNPATVNGADALLLQSSGKSVYREVEFGVHFTASHGVDVNASYVRSVARSDLNAFTMFYDSVLTPVVGENGYGPARTDVPHRLLVRARANPIQNWLLVATLDWRDGLPYSVVNEMLDYVGPRNDHRFPSYARVDLRIDHRFKLGKFRPWIGFRVDNALASFLPADVQANITSPAFGSFYNTEYRQERVQLRFER